MQFLASFASIVGLGFVYFVGAIPAGAALKLPVWAAALAGWLGYSLGAVVVALAGQPLRDRLMRRFKISPNPKNPNVVMRAWNRWGLPALGLLAPVTIGPQVGALLGIALGVNRTKLVAAISLGAIPWAAGIATLIALGVKIAR